MNTDTNAEDFLKTVSDWIGMGLAGLVGEPLTLNTLIKFPDGRIGTICWHHVDGYDGVWGEHTFVMPDATFGNLPAPQFMLREQSAEPTLRRFHKTNTLECVGRKFEIKPRAA